MPRWVSKNGEWHPALEKVSLIDHAGKEGRQPGEPYIYEGPDRAALFELFKAGVEKLGVHFMHDSDLIRRVKELGFKDVKEYAKHYGWDEKKVLEEFNKKAAVVAKHELPAKVRMIETMGGGLDTAGQGQDKKGGFDLPPEIK
jgi:hypothetical protein